MVPLSHTVSGPWLKRLASASHRGGQSSPEQFMKDVTDSEALEQGGLRQLWFSMSVSFHQCCTHFNSFITDTV